MKSFLVIFGLLLVGCPKAGPVPVDPHDKGLEQDLGKMCVNLEKIGCPEGTMTGGPNSRTCYAHFSALQAMVDIPIDCLAKATTQDIARRCGDDNTTRVRCIP